MSVERLTMKNDRKEVQNTVLSPNEQQLVKMKDHLVQWFHGNQTTRVSSLEFFRYAQRDSFH